MTSIRQRMDAAGNRPAGFDYMRLVLATSVILVHGFAVTGSKAHEFSMWSGPDRGIIGLILPTFFALSGFLVTGSLERNKSLASFLGLRVIRLIPALAFEVIISAFVLGTIFTQYSLSSYFGSPTFRAYFLNIVGDIHFYLPGVFSHNPDVPRVNEQLWTIPWELKCYLALAALAVFGIANRRRLLLWGFLSAQVLVILYIIRHPYYDPVFPGKILVGCFLAGVLAFKYRDRIPASILLAACAAALTIAGLLVPDAYYFISLPVAYLACYLGTLNPRRTWIVSSGDYSYGLYLYGFPIQQAFTALGSWTYNPALDLCVALPVTFIVAWTSWHFVERPALRLKRCIASTEDWLLSVPLLEWHSRKIFKAT